MRNRALWLLAIASVVVCWPLAAQQTTGGTPDWLSQAKIAAQLEGVTVGEAVRRARLQNLAIKQAERFATDPDFAGSWIERSGNALKETQYNRATYAETKLGGIIPPIAAEVAQRLAEMKAKL